MCVQKQKIGRIVSGEEYRKSVVIGLKQGEAGSESGGIDIDPHKRLGEIDWRARTECRDCWVGQIENKESPVRQQAVERQLNIDRTDLAVGVEAELINDTRGRRFGSDQSKAQYQQNGQTEAPGAGEEVGRRQSDPPR